MTLIRRLVGALAACGLASCAGAPHQSVYVAPTSETVFTAIEEMTAGPGQIVYVQNRSSVPVTVYSVTLRDCENVKGQCNSPRTMNLRISPDSRATLVRVEPAVPARGFGFHFTFGWRADSSSIAALGALASVGDTTAVEQLGSIQRAEAHRRGAVGAQDLSLTPAEIGGLAGRAGSLRAIPDSLVLSVGQRVTLDTIRVLLVGTRGETLGRLHAVQWRMTSSLVSVIRPDTLLAAAAGRTALQFKVPEDVLPGNTAVHTTIQVPIIVR